MLRSLPFVVLSLALPAQQFAPSTGRVAAEIPPGFYTVVALADCDGDGDQDAAVNDITANRFAVLRRGPSDTWTTIGLFPGIVTAAAWADMDGDGDRDLLIGTTGTPAPAPFGIVRNDGAAFPWRGPAPGGLIGTVNRFAIGDIDGDLRPDVVVGLSTGVEIARNLGNTTFGAATVLTVQTDARPVLFDRDNDGDLDLAIASSAGVTLFDNVAGVFTDISATLPAGTDGTDVVAGDLDGDGRSDLAFARGDAVDVLYNRATGWQRAVAVVTIGEPVRALLVGDLDRDGDRDLVVGMLYAAEWLRNDGSGSFARLPALSYGGSMQLSVLALGDGAARGAVDVVGTFFDRAVRTFYGSAPQPFVDPQALPSPAGFGGSYPGTLAVGDIDGDGRPDMVSPMDREVLHDDGRGQFSRTPLVGARANYAEAALVDLDGDGDLDLLLGTTSLPVPPFVPIQRFANDGLGHFTFVQDIVGPGFIRDFRFGDVDGDGDVDMLGLASFGQVQWFQNVGGGQLVDTGVIGSGPQGIIVNSLVFEDLDGDGDRDLVGTQVGDTLPVYLNNGSGVFTTVSSLALTPGTFAISLRAGDVDGDGALDIVVDGGLLYHNNGTGVFTRRNGAIPPNTSGLADFVDVDEDGDLDLFTAGYPGRLLINDGTGTFSDGSARLWSTTFGAARFADIDEDGDVDMLAMTGNGWQRIVDRQRGAETMQVVRAGGAMQVRFFVQPYQPVAGTLVIPMVALAPGASTAIAGIRGRLLLPLASTVMLGAVNASAGTAVTGFAIPNLPGLLGVELCVQGLVLGPGLPLGFTNVVDERILP